MDAEHWQATQGLWRASGASRCPLGRSLLGFDRVGASLHVDRGQLARPRDRVFAVGTPGDGKGKKYQRGEDQIIVWFHDFDP